MKFDTLEKEAVSIGDIKANNVSIDTNNINFIVTILSTNLYSKPIQSFIRETVSNAWDSHVEAGVTEPVILELGKDSEGNYFCRIQDFGVGLSPERFNDVYKNIGSSTKRSDNNQIGGFGIGRFSALAYSDVVNITSNHNGKQYKYMMYKDGNSISIDLLYEGDTIERNGLEVQLNLKHTHDITNFYNAIKEQLVYFENLYFIDNTNTTIIPKDEFNNFHIKKYDTFFVNDLDKGSNIDLVLGKVRYPLRLDSLSKSYPGYISNYPISLKFEIGDLDVTPNREEILYSQKNIDKIQSVLDDSIEVIDTIFEEHSNKDYIHLTEYVKAIGESHTAPLMEIDGETKVSIKINSHELKITFNGKKYDKTNFLKLYNHIMTKSLIPVPYQLSYGRKLNYCTGAISLSSIKEHIDMCMFADISSLNNMSKTYIREEIDTGMNFIFSSKKLPYFYKKYIEFVNGFCKQSYNNTYYDSDSVKVILKSVTNNMLRLMKAKSFNDKSVPQSYIDKKKAEEKYKRSLRKNAGIDWSQNLNIFNLRNSDKSAYNVTTNSETFNLSDIKKKYRLQTVYAEKQNEKLRTLFTVLGNVSNVKFVEIAETRQKLLNNGFDNFIKLENFMDIKYKLIRQIATAQLIRNELPYLGKLMKLHKSLGKISTKLSIVVDELNSYSNKYINTNRLGKDEQILINEIYQLAVDNNYFDEEIRAVLNSNLDMLKKAESILLFADDTGTSYKIPDNRINLVVDYVLVRKLFRPDVSAVIKLKKETILNIKQEENEDNKN